MADTKVTTTNPWTALAPQPRPLDPAKGEKYHVFLSYRSVNRTWVLNLYDVLVDHGFEVFLDQVRLVVGSTLRRSLEEGLERSQAGILVWSAAARDSTWVRDEYDTMMERNQATPRFQFVPVRLDDSSLPTFARNRLFLDFSGYPDGPNGGELLRLLHGIVGKPLSPEAMRFASEQDDASHRATSTVQALLTAGQADALLALFEAGGVPWATSSVLGCRVAEGLARLGRYDDAIAVCQRLTTSFPRAVRPRQLEAHALTRRKGEGDLDLAQQILLTLEHEGHRDAETMGMQGRTWMDRYERDKDPLHLAKSRDAYLRGFEWAPDDSYVGINAAAKSIFIGKPDDIAKGAELAKQVEALVGTQRVHRDYWKTATVAEVMLIQQRYADAAKMYEAAVLEAPEERGSHQSSWTQAQRLMDAMGTCDKDRRTLAEVFAHLEPATVERGA